MGYRSLGQISPPGIHSVDEINLLLTRTCLDLFLKSNGSINIVRYFIKNQLVNILPIGEAPYHFLAMLIYALFQIARNAGVQHAVVAISQNIDAIFFSHISVSHCERDSFIFARGIASLRSQ